MVQDQNEKCNVLIVMGDGRYGSMFERFLCQMHTRDFNQIVGLVDSRYIEKSSRKLSSDTNEELPDNCKVEYIDFEQFYGGSEEEVNRIFQGYQIDWLCLLPFGNTFRKSEHVEEFLKTFKKNRGRNVLLLSSVGAESPRVPLGDLKACEEQVRTHFPTMNCTLRMQVPLEDFEFFCEAVKKEKTWKLPSGDGSFGPVAFRDDVVFAAAVVMKEKTIERRHADQTYTLTGNMAVNGITLAQMTSAAFDERDVKFVAISSNEAREIIDREIEKRKKEKGAAATETSSGFQIGQSITGIDIEYTSRVECEMILNRFEMAHDHELNIITTHVHDLTSHQPVTVPAYLRSHEDSFKGKK